MNNEEFDKKVNFIVDQQAQFYAALQRLEEKQEENQKQIEQHQKLIEQTQKQLDQLTNSVIGLASVVGILSEKYTQLSEKYIQLVEMQTRLAESQEHTDKRLDVLIDLLIKRNPLPEDSADNHPKPTE